MTQHLEPGTYYLAVSSITQSNLLGGNRGYVLDTVFDPALPAFQSLPVIPKAVGDFNHDGISDLLASDASGVLSVLLGRGDGTFFPSYNLSVFAGPLAVGDFNHDGNTDLVIGNPATSYKTVSVLLGQGDGAFLLSATLPVDSVISEAVGDFNNDGKPDLIVVEDLYTTVLFQGRGDGTFLPAPPLNASQRVSVGDFNHDGKADLVSTGFGAGYLMLGRGDDTFLPPATIKGLESVSFITVGDFNRDGNPDLIATSGNGNNPTVSVLLGRGDATFLPGTVIPGAIDFAIPLVGDFNGDGYSDLIVNNSIGQPASVLLGRGDGTFLSPPDSRASVGQSPFSVAEGDLNRDGYADLITVNINAGTASVLLGRGDGTFLPAASLALGGRPFFVALQDFNNDGNLDLTIYDPLSGEGSLLLGRGDGTFLPGTNLGLKGFVSAGDFNNDGNLDFAIAYAGTMSILLGRGDGSFQLPAPALPPNAGISPGSPMVVGDFNNDGNLDLAIIQADILSMIVLLGQGDGTFQITANGQVLGGSSRLMATRDFNGDGNLDLVAVAGGYVLILLGRGDGTFQDAAPYRVGDGASGVAVGDFNGDGKFDVATTNFYSGTVSILLGRGDGTFLPAFDHPVGVYPGAVTVTDFNRDGNLDVAIANSGEGSVSILMGQGNGQFQTVTPASGIAIRHIPYLANLDGVLNPDSLILRSSGDLLFRRGLAGTLGQFSPPIVINPGSPARDVTVFHTSFGWAIAAIDNTGNAVSIYTWNAATGSFQRRLGFATGNLPVRIASRDLTGDGLDDLVVTNDFDHSVTIALQHSGGAFSTVTRPVGVGPSDIAFANERGQAWPDIVVSDQVSGDFSVLHNDPNHSFAQQSRYRAGAGLFDINIDANTGEQSILSQLQTVGIVAGKFTGGKSDDLITLNRNAKSFTLFPNQGQGIFAKPQSGNAYFPTSDQPAQVVSLTLPGNVLPSVAILMQDLGQIWIYRNHGDGTFGAPTVVNAGNDPSGFTVTKIGGRLALLVGNSFGDILILLYDGHGNFVADRANLQNAPLTVGTIAATGQQFAVVADQGHDLVSLYYRIPGTHSFGKRIPISGTSQLPLLAPGAVQTFYVLGDVNPYLAVTNSLSNNVLVYHFDSGSGHFRLLQGYAVGDNPVSVTVAALNGDGVPDLLVANRGSNDVSVLIGALDPTNHVWTATLYQRLKSHGSGPLAVAVQNTGGSNGPNLLVTNSDGTVVVLPGIGSNNAGSGFFQDTNPQTFNLGRTIVQSLFDITTGQVFVVGGDGSVSTLNNNIFITIVSQGVAALDEFGTLLVAGFVNGDVGVFSVDGTLLASQPTGFTDEPSALEALSNGSQLDVFATQNGSEVPIIVSFALPIVTELPTSPAVALATDLPGNDLVLVAIFVQSGVLEEHQSGNTEATILGQDAAILGLASVLLDQEVVVSLLQTGSSVQEEIFVMALTPAPGWQPEAPDWRSYPLGVNEALRQRLQRQQIYNNVEDILDIIRDVLRQYGIFLQPTTGLLQVEPIPATDALLATTLENLRDLAVAGTSDESAAPATPVEVMSQGTTQFLPDADVIDSRAASDWKVSIAACLVAALSNPERKAQKRYLCRYRSFIPVAFGGGRQLGYRTFNKNFFIDRVFLVKVCLARRGSPASTSSK